MGGDVSDLAVQTAREALAAAVADRKTKELALDTALADQKDRNSPLAREAKDATSRQTIAQANEEVTKATKAAVDAMTPDLSKIKGNKTSIDGKTVIYASRLASMAIEDAATAVAASLKGSLTGVSKDKPARVLLTGDPKLIDTEAVYWEFVEQAHARLLAGQAALDALKADGSVTAEAVDSSEITRRVARLRRPYEEVLAQPRGLGAAAFGLSAPIVEAAAKLIPQFVSLFAVDRTISSADPVVADSLSAHAAVAHELFGIEGLEVVHDDFRSIHSAFVVSIVDQLAQMMQVLERAAAACTAYLDAHPQSAAPLNPTVAERMLNDALAASRLRVTTLQAELSSESTGIKQFIVDSSTVQAGSVRSVLAVAAMREQLHGGVADFDFVLLVPTPVVDTEQVLSDRAIGWDSVSVAGSASMTYLLLDTRSGALKDAGIAQGSAGMQGRVGTQLRLEPTANTQPKGVNWWVVARSVLLAGAGLLLLLAPALSNKIFTVVAVAIALDGVVGIVQAAVLRNRLPQWGWLLAQGFAVLAVFVAVAGRGEWVPWGIAAYGLVCGLLGTRSTYGLAGPRSQSLAALVGAMGIALGILTAALLLFVALDWTHVLPFVFGLYATVAGLVLLVASIQESSAQAGKSSS